MKELLKRLQIDYLLVNSTNKYLVEYPKLSENARYTLTGFSGSTGDALVAENEIYLFVDGRYHIQADLEAYPNVKIVKLQIGQHQDDEIKKLISSDKVLGIVSKKVSRARLEGFSGYKIKLLEEDPINDFTVTHSRTPQRAFDPVKYFSKPALITNLEEVSYLTGLRDLEDNSSKIWAKLFLNGEDRKLFYEDEECDEFLSEYNGDLLVDKTSINAHDYSLIKNPVDKNFDIKFLKSVKTEEELLAYKIAFEQTDKTILAIREFINENENLSEFDIAEKLREEYLKNGARSLSFNPIVAINKNSAQAHYSKNSKDVILKDGDLVLIDSGAYYESGLATDITRVFVKGEPNNIQKQVYTTVLKSFLHCFNYDVTNASGIEIDTLAHKILDNSIEGFVFNHGLGHGIGINVHEAPPNLSQNEIAKTKIENGMCFTIEPGLYNPEYFGVRLENSCYKKDGKIHSFVKMGYEGKLIDFNMLTEQEKLWLKEFEVL